jgi:hypothetical protein
MAMTAVRPRQLHSRIAIRLGDVLVLRADHEVVRVDAQLIPTHAMIDL